MPYLILSDTLSFIGVMYVGLESADRIFMLTPELVYTKTDRRQSEL